MTSVSRETVNDRVRNGPDFNPYCKFRVRNANRREEGVVMTGAGGGLRLI